MLEPIIVEHPMIAHKVSLLRDENTSCKDFRELISEVSMFLCYEATRDLPLEEVEITTPMCKTVAKRIEGKKLVFVPILRAGLGMCDSMLALIPAAKVGHIGLFRDPVTHTPHEYYCKLPEDTQGRDVIVIDPMLATGGSAIDAITAIKKRDPKSIKFICIISCPEGLDALSKAHPDVQIYTAAKDERLDENKYIIPGLGDAGDRIFGTK